jgi:hypothetical protein
VQGPVDRVDELTATRQEEVRKHACPSECENTRQPNATARGSPHAGGDLANQRANSGGRTSETRRKEHAANPGSDEVRLPGGWQVRSGAVIRSPGLPAVTSLLSPVGAASGVNVFALSQRSLRFIVITHRQASDPVWWPYRTALKQSAASRQSGSQMIVIGP